MFGTFIILNLFPIDAYIYVYINDKQDRTTNF